MKKIALQELQEVYYSCLGELIKFLDENNIKYYAIAGTLLGAVRHNGFIPWDDDVDLGMLRKDYNKFLEVCDNLDKSKFDVINFHNKKYVDHALTKLGLIGYKNLNTNKIKKLDDYFHIDIFPLDTVYLSEKKRIKNIRKIKFIKLLLYFKSKRNKCSFIKMIITYCFKFILLPLSFNHLCRKLEALVIKPAMEKKDCQDIVWLSAGVYSFEKESHPISDFTGDSFVKFGPLSLMAPKDPHTFLKRVYGDDYMTPKIRNSQKEFNGAVINE